MNIEGKIAVVTNGTSGIGLALAARFIVEGAVVILSGANEKKLKTRAAQIGATPIVANTTKKEDVKNLVDKATKKFGRIDLFVSNICFAGFDNIFSTDNNRNACWHLNVMSQMYAAKYVLPQMISRGSGYFLNIIPSAGLEEEFHLPLYSTTKHEALSFAERLVATYRNAGIKVSVLCHGSLRPSLESGNQFMREKNPEPEVLMDRIIYGIWKEQFLIYSTKRCRNVVRSRAC